MKKYAWLVLVTACDLGAVEDDAYWDETREDDGTEIIAAGGNKRVAINAGKTTDAELIKLLPVGRSENGAARRVVLQLSPADLPKLEAGDRLITPAEAQVTTRCDVGQNAPGCNYNPNVRAQLIITGNASDTSAGGNAKVIATQTQSCTRAEHHCMFVFRPGDASVNLTGLPCVANNSCYVNLVMWAWHGDARGGDQDKVLVGGNDGNYLDNGEVDGDAARLMVVRERGIGAADRAARDTNGGGSFNVNTNANPELVYSLRLKPAGQTLQAGEQFLVEARIVTDVSSRARFSTQMFLTKDPNATDGNGVAAISPGPINEHNGINCLPGGDCVTRKVAVFKVDQAIGDAVYVNIIAKSAVPGGGSARVTVKRNDGFLKAVRYSASYAQ